MAVHRFNVPPSDFWQMRPRHFWYLYEVEAGAEKTRRAQPGKLSSAEVARLKRLIED